MRSRWFSSVLCVSTLIRRSRCLALRRRRRKALLLQVSCLLRLQLDLQVTLQDSDRLSLTTAQSVLSSKPSTVH